VQMCIAGVKINAIVGLFNCIPLPPLDGSKVVSACLPKRAAFNYARLEPYGLCMLLFFIASGTAMRVLQPIYIQLLMWLQPLLPS